MRRVALISAREPRLPRFAEYALVEADAALDVALRRVPSMSMPWSGRGASPVCPQCRKPLRGSDLLVSGHCSHCARSITALLLPRQQTGAPDQGAYLALLGALGGLVGLALASTGGGGG